MARMTAEQFNNGNHTNLRRCIQLLETLIDVVELSSYGLAPNVNGFCYEMLTAKQYLDGERLALLFELDKTLDVLSTEEEVELKHLYL